MRSCRPPSRTSRLYSVLRAKLKKSEQYLVLFLSKLVHRAICGLLQNSVDDCLLEFISDFGGAEDFNHRGQRVHQVFHEMFNTARAATEVPLQAGAHHSPPQSRPITHGVVRIRDTQHSLLNEIHDLFIEGRLESVCDVAGKLLMKMDGLLSDRRVKFHRLLDRFGRCFSPANDFNQRNDVRRIERMTDQDTLGPLAFRLHDAWRYSR